MIKQKFFGHKKETAITRPLSLSPLYQAEISMHIGSHGTTPAVIFTVSFADSN